MRCMHAGLWFEWRKDTITNEFDPSSIFIVCDVKYNINMPSQIIIMAQEVYTNVSRTEEKQKRKKAAQRSRAHKHTQSNGNREKSNETPWKKQQINVLRMSLFALCSNNFLVVNKALNAVNAAIPLNSAYGCMMMIEWYGLNGNFENMENISPNCKW